jgi:hypothetical protein
MARNAIDDGWGMNKAAGSIATLMVALLAGVAAEAACLDVREDKLLVMEGTLNFQIFGGPPYNGGVSRGDTPEPTFIMRLDEPICAIGDDFIDPKQRVDQVQIFPSDPAVDAGLWKALRGLIGRRIRVEGRSAFGAHTGHHHAPLLLPITRVTAAPDPTEAYGTAMTTVQAFYLALAAGSGEEAARFVVPEKRAAGPLSADAMTRFYRDLEQPLSLLDVSRVGPDEYRVRYRFVARGQRRCDGAAVVRTVARNGENLISSIKALSGC